MDDTSSAPKRGGTVWLFISTQFKVKGAHETVNLNIWKSNISAKSYVQVLEQHVLPSFRGGLEYFSILQILQQQQDSIHSRFICMAPTNWCVLICFRFAHRCILLIFTFYTFCNNGCTKNLKLEVYCPWHVNLDIKKQMATLYHRHTDYTSWILSVTQRWD